MVGGKWGWQRAQLIYLVPVRSSTYRTTFYDENNLIPTWIIRKFGTTTKVFIWRAPKCEFLCSHKNPKMLTLSQNREQPRPTTMAHQKVVLVINCGPLK